MSNAGAFTISLSEPYPIWCELHYEDEFIARFSHKSLSDLQYVITKAIMEARDRLPYNKKWEV